MQLCRTFALQLTDCSNKQEIARFILGKCRKMKEKHHKFKTINEGLT